jgi:hypothetical protein
VTHGTVTVQLEETQRGHSRNQCRCKTTVQHDVGLAPRCGPRSKRCAAPTSAWSHSLRDSSPRR